MAVFIGGPGINTCIRGIQYREFSFESKLQQYVLNGSVSRDQLIDVYCTK